MCLITLTEWCPLEGRVGRLERDRPAAAAVRCVGGVEHLQMVGQVEQLHNGAVGVPPSGHVLQLRASDHRLVAAPRPQQQHTMSFIRDTV